MFYKHIFKTLHLCSRWIIPCKAGKPWGWQLCEKHCYSMIHKACWTACCCREQSLKSVLYGSSHSVEWWNSTSQTQGMAKNGMIHKAASLMVLGCSMTLTEQKSVHWLWMGATNRNGLWGHSCQWLFGNSWQLTVLFIKLLVPKLLAIPKKPPAGMTPRDHSFFDSFRDGRVEWWNSTSQIMVRPGTMRPAALWIALLGAGGFVNGAVTKFNFYTAELPKTFPSSRNAYPSSFKVKIPIRYRLINLSITYYFN